MSVNSRTKNMMQTADQDYLEKWVTRLSLTFLSEEWCRSLVLAAKIRPSKNLSRNKCNPSLLMAKSKCKGIGIAKACLALGRRQTSSHLQEQKVAKSNWKTRLRSKSWKSASSDPKTQPSQPQRRKREARGFSPIRSVLQKALSTEKADDKNNWIEDLNQKRVFDG